MSVLIMFELLLTECMPYLYITMYAIFIFIHNNVRRINTLLVNQLCALIHRTVLVLYRTILVL